MCGIAGIVAFGASSAPTMEQLARMCGAIYHRGPDEDGMDIRAGVALGMRRLSIIDLQGGRQPIFNEDQTVRTVFNGEIYNFRELRRQLEAAGHLFRTRTDTEVIVHAYEEFGSEFAGHLNGMFAIALHDMKRHKLILVRDHLGIKPCYFSFARKYLVFGSEIKAILASGLVRRELDVDALGQFMAWEYIPGDQTLFKSTSKLKPGEMLEIDLQRPECRPRVFWDIPAVPEIMERSEADWRDEVDAKVRECVRRQLVSDVPLGAFLSGGVDSSLMVAAMGRAKTFSIGFDDPTYSELPWARQVASHLGVDHADEIIKPDICQLFDDLIHYMDDPIADFSIFPTFLVSRMARKHVTVALGGDGGDELFGGYESYLAHDLERKYNFIPSVMRKKMIEPAVNALRPRQAKKGLVNKAKRFVEGLGQPMALSHARWRIFTGEAQRKAIFTNSARVAMDTEPGDHIAELFRKAGDRQPLNKSLYVDVKSYLAENILVKVDRMSMAVSLETRVPYLDKELVELAFRIPDKFKVANGQTKVLLKKVAAGYLSKTCVYRKKEGFSIPIKNWLKAELRPVMEDLLEPGRIRCQGLFQALAVERLKKEHLAGRENHSHVLWAMMMFQAWSKRWLR